MPLNPNIALSYKGIELENPLDRYSKFMSIQSAQQQNALAQRQIQQEDEFKNYLRSTNLSTPEGRAGLRQFGNVGLAYENALTDQEINSLKRDELGLKVQEQRLSALGTGLTSVLQDPSDANLETAFKQLESVNIDTTPFRQQFAQITDPAQRKAVITQYALTNEVGRKALEFVQPKPVRANIGGMDVWVDENPNSPTYMQEVKSVTRTMTPAETAAAERDKQRLQFEGQRVGFERQRVGLEGRRVAAIEENARRGTVQGSTPVQKPMTPVQEAARRDKLGKEFKAAQNALQTTQDVLDSIAFVKSEPGLDRATGFTGTLLPSFPEGKAASAEVRLKNLEGKVTALGKAQAAASGAIGAIANQEWKMLADQIAAIDRLKGTGPLLAQLELVEAQAQGAMERIRDAYQRQFGEDFQRFPQFADLPAPKTSFKPRSSTGSKPTGTWSVVK